MELPPQPFLDPRTKIAVMLVVNTCSFVYTNEPLVMATLMAVTVFLFLIDRLYTFAFVVTVVSIVIASLAWLSPLVIPQIGRAVGLILQYIFMYVPAVSIGLYVLRSTTASQIVVAAKRSKIPDTITIPMAVTLRFFPAVFTEMKAVHTAMRLAGGVKASGLTNPFHFVEHLMIPLVTSVLRIGDTLTASALIRGLGSPGPKTSISQSGFTRRDWIGVVCIGLIVLVIVATKVYDLPI